MASSVSAKTRKEDEEDIALLVKGGYDTLASLSGFPGWAFSDEEVGKIARPAARILERHTGTLKVVRQIADPIALGAAVIVPTGMRWAAYKFWRAQGSPDLSGMVVPPRQNHNGYVPPEEPVYSEAPPRTFGNKEVPVPEEEIDRLRRVM